MIILDSVGNTLTKIKNHHRLTGKGIVILNTPMYYFMNTIRILEPEVDTLNIVKQDTIESYAIFNLGKMRMEPHPDLSLAENEEREALNRLKEKL